MRYNFCPHGLGSHSTSIGIAQPTINDSCLEIVAVLVRLPLQIGEPEKFRHFEIPLEFHFSVYFTKLINARRISIDDYIGHSPMTVVGQKIDEIHAKMTPSFPSSESNNSFVDICCRICRKSGWETPQSLLSHVNVAHQVLLKAYPCPDCRLTGFSRKRALTLHQKSGSCLGVAWETSWNQASVSLATENGPSNSKPPRSGSFDRDVQSSVSSRIDDERLSCMTSRKRQLSTPERLSPPPKHKKSTDGSSGKEQPTKKTSTNSTAVMKNSNSGPSSSSTEPATDNSKSRKVPAGRCSLLDWDSFINLPKKTRSLSLKRHSEPIAPSKSLGSSTVTPKPDSLHAVEKIASVHQPPPIELSEQVPKVQLQENSELPQQSYGPDQHLVETVPDINPDVILSTKKHPKAIAGITLSPSSAVDPILTGRGILTPVRGEQFPLLTTSTGGLSQSTPSRSSVRRNRNSSKNAVNMGLHDTNGTNDFYPAHHEVKQNAAHRLSGSDPDLPLAENLSEDCVATTAHLERKSGYNLSTTTRRVSKRKNLHTSPTLTPFASTAEVRSLPDHKTPHFEGKEPNEGIVPPKAASPEKKERIQKPSPSVSASDKGNKPEVTRTSTDPIPLSSFATEDSLVCSSIRIPDETTASVESSSSSHHIPNTPQTTTTVTVSDSPTGEHIVISKSALRPRKSSGSPSVTACPRCLRTVFQPHGLQRHLRLCKGVSTNNPNEEPSPPLDEKLPTTPPIKSPRSGGLRCPHCNKRFGKACGIVIHIRTCKSAGDSTSETNSVSPQTIEPRKHNVSPSVTPPALNCPHCLISFKHLRQMTAHMARCRPPPSPIPRDELNRSVSEGQIATLKVDKSPLNVSLKKSKDKTNTNKILSENGSSTMVDSDIVGRNSSGSTKPEEHTATKPATRLRSHSSTPTSQPRSSPNIRTTDHSQVEYTCDPEEHFPRMRLRIRHSEKEPSSQPSSPRVESPPSEATLAPLPPPSSTKSGKKRRSSVLSHVSTDSLTSSMDDLHSTISDATTMPALQEGKLSTRNSMSTRNLSCTWCRQSSFTSVRLLSLHLTKCPARPRTLTTHSRSTTFSQIATRNKLGLSIKLWPCGSCGLKFRSRPVLRAHVAAGCQRGRKVAHAQTNEPCADQLISCPGCPKNASRFESSEAVLTHLLSLKPGAGHPYANHGLLSTAQLWPAFLSIPNLGFGCHICGLLLASESRLDKHKRAAHEAWLQNEHQKALSPQKRSSTG